MNFKAEKLLILTATAYLLTACGGQDTEKHDEQHDEHHEEQHAGQKHEENHGHDHESGEHHEHEGESEMQSTKEGKQVNLILNQYLAVKDALVNDDAEKAKAEAGKLAGMDAKIDMESLKKVYGSIKESANKIAEEEQIEAQRKAFEALTLQMEKAIQDYGLSGKKVYKQYCPMAFDNKGASWLALEEEINNPYFGSSMLHCGKVQETMEYK